MFSFTDSDDGMVLNAVVACCVEGGILLVNCMSEIGSTFALLLRSVTMMLSLEAVELLSRL